jgi:adenosine deaminase
MDVFDAYANKTEWSDHIENKKNPQTYRYVTETNRFKKFDSEIGSIIVPELLKNPR